MGRTLQDYFEKAYKAGVIDHSVRVSRDQAGRITFYIHPADVSGDTYDFVVSGDSLTLRFPPLDLKES